MGRLVAASNSNASAASCSTDMMDNIMEGVDWDTVGSLVDDASLAYAREFPKLMASQSSGETQDVSMEGDPGRVDDDDVEMGWMDDDQDADNARQGTPSPPSQNTAGPSQQLAKQGPGRISKETHRVIELVFSAVDELVDDISAQTGIVASRVRSILKRMLEGKDVVWSKIPDTTHGPEKTKQLLESGLRQADSAFDIAASQSGRTKDSIVAKYFKTYAHHQQGNEWNEFNRANGIIANARKAAGGSTAVGLMPSEAADAYSRAKDNGDLDKKLEALRDTLSTANTAQMTAVARRNLLESFKHSSSNLIRTAERANAAAIVLCVGAGIHQDQNFIHLDTSSGLQGFLEKLTGLSTDDILGLARTWSCSTHPSVNALQKVSQNNSQDLLKQMKAADPALGNTKVSKASSPVKHLSPAKQPPLQGYRNSSGIAGTPSTPQPLKSTANPVPAFDASPTKAGCRTILDDRVSMVVPNPPLLTVFTKDALVDWCVWTQRRKSHPIVFGSISTKNSPTSDISLTHYPVRFVFPGEETKGKTNSTSQGLKGVSVGHLRICYDAVTAPNGKLVLEPADTDDFLNSRKAIIITAPPMLTGDQMDNLKTHDSYVLGDWPVPAGHRFFLDQSVDCKGPPAVLVNDIASATFVHGAHLKRPKAKVASEAPSDSSSNAADSRSATPCIELSDSDDQTTPRAKGKAPAHKKGKKTDQFKNGRPDFEALAYEEDENGRTSVGSLGATHAIDRRGSADNRDSPRLACASSTLLGWRPFAIGADVHHGLILVPTHCVVSCFGPPGQHASVASQQLLPASTSNAPPPPPPPQASTSAAPNPLHHPAALPQLNIPQFGTPGLDMASLFQMVADQLNKGGAGSR
ncbi:hypothetical protein CC1G_12804 [Coprinopsis cinerea okayama7|uniref:Uncharacterized protein n=1 Tax=Coprinopsis cinerea (strain Okayama-7 / 130 / ATCC MYA-4618 / FGSC 9003) TaxID=240176 RepID=A8MZT8_COPC7|nr:hypothetical protein CC1G_12804 [Coprinopsis cinerea okayama7\|eukprot:XP_001828150.2 hypothetical protein CC1G_12804 [Coprinopsis cinerea okayama7\